MSAPVPTTPRLWRVATRGSRLALTQTGQVVEALRQRHPEASFDIQIIRTSGDHMQSGPVKAAETTKNIFTKEIEEALLAGEADLAVHSCKDLGVRLPDGLVLAASPERRDARDVLVLRAGAEDPFAARPVHLLTGSIRRHLQWLARRPGDTIEPIRGNIDTRIAKLLAHPTADALVLAAAGLERLQPEIGGCRVLPLDAEVMVPAPGQGALALQCRADDADARALLATINHEPTCRAVAAERAFLVAMNAGCQEPIGAFARIVGPQGDTLELEAIDFPDATPNRVVRHRLTQPLHEDPAELGRKLAGVFMAGASGN